MKTPIRRPDTSAPGSATANYQRLGAAFDVIAA
jgi:hypothetical protein